MCQSIFSSTKVAEKTMQGMGQENACGYERVHFPKKWGALGHRV